MKDSAVASSAAPQTRHRAGSDAPFFVALGTIGGSYLLLILLMLAADLAFTSPAHFKQALQKPEILYAVRLTLISCTISALLSLLVATPLGYLLSRVAFRGRWVIDTALNIPVVLPPLVIGLSLLILFHLPLGGSNLEQLFEEYLGVRITYAAPAVVLCNSRWPAPSRYKRCASRSIRLTFAPNRSP